MGMAGSLLKISPARLSELQADPDSVESMMDEIFDGGLEQKGQDSCNVDKSWQTIHVLLSGGDPWGVTNIESQAILGGAEIGPDLGYGPARYLTAEQVKAVADSLQSIDAAELARRFDATQMANAEIYAFNSQHPEEELEIAQHYYKDLREFYQNAAQQEHAVLLFIC